MSERKADHWGELATSAAVDRAVERLGGFAVDPTELEARRRYLDFLAVTAGQRVLDVGAGIGTIAIELARRVGPDGSVTALDPSAELLEIAAERAHALGLRLTTEVADARELPHPDGSFDAALCHWVLLHVAPPEQIAAEMRRVVRPGGRVLCVECDWETATVSPGERAVTRRILNASTDRQLDGWVGRKLVGILRDAGLGEVRVLPVVDVETEPGAWLEFLRSRIGVAVEAGQASQAEADDWFRELELAALAGRYFFSVTQFAVVGTVPAATGAGP